ncbi:tetratricopeptide repeat protein, partial [Chamaesiphon sp. OTE_20_metabat_361]|uniref:tetratricopeptide repeat protein n=1 Tax=Chamaesiphon sp. OTE_20_metabat_361 TaxID=2964689 RepID=UPI00286C6B56
ERTIYSAGFPFDSKDIRITSGKVSQLSDLPFDNGTQIGYTTNKGEKGIRQGMSGGAILDERGTFLGINTIGAAPILPNYTYNDGSKPLAKLAAKYRTANWGVPVYNFLTNVKPDILYGYDNLPKVAQQPAPTGYIAERNQQARKMTVRIENNQSGSGVIVAREGNNYYVLTAKHVVENKGTAQIVTYDQDRHPVTSTVVAKGTDLAVVKFSSTNVYPTGKLNRSSPNSGDIVFVGGFPGRAKINSPLWQWQLNPGFVYSREQGKFETQTQATFADRYDLLYSSISYGGMSGGPVLDRAGNIIGIHGRGEGEDFNSAGISIQTFTGLLTQLGVAPKLLTVIDTPPAPLTAAQNSNIRQAMENITPPQGSDERGERSLAYGRQLYRMRKYRKAVEAFRTAAARGQVVSGNYGLALALGLTGDLRSATDAISQAIAAVSKEPASVIKGSYYLWRHQSVLWRLSGNYPQALAAIDKAIALEPSDLTLRNERARILIVSDNKSAAIEEYNLIINRQPEAYTYYNRGVVKYQLGQRIAALQDFDRAITLDPQSASAYYNRGIVKYQLGQKIAALQDYDRAISINPQHAKAYGNRGIVKSELGQKIAALQDFDRAISINPQLAQAYGNRGIVKSELGQKIAALQDLDRAIALNPQLADAYNNRGAVKYQLEQKIAALQDFDRATTLNSQYAEAYYNRGLIKAELGQEESAIGDIRRAAELFRQQGRMDLYQKAMSLIR